MAIPVNLVLSGGGARGIAHMGIIEVLEENGFEIKAITGTSMGALVGGIYAANGLPDYKEWLLNIDIRQAVKYVDFSLKLPGLIKGEKIMQKISKMLSVHEIENLPIAYKAVATDLNHNAGVVFTSGDLVTAMRASISIPTVFTPVFMQDKMLVDGGLVNNIPVDKLPPNGFPVIAVCANADVPVTAEMKAILKGNQEEEEKYFDKIRNFQKLLQKRFNIRNTKDKISDDLPGYREIIHRSLHLMIAQNSMRLLTTHTPDLLINIPLDLAGTLDFLKADKIYQIGRLIAENALKNFKSY